LINAAAQMGQTPEEVALQWLSEAAQQITDDPIEQFIGTIPSQIPDWTTQHDVYLGQNLITDALTNDHHFEQAGFIRLLK
jgi:hypothetical protein